MKPRSQEWYELRLRAIEKKEKRAAAAVEVPIKKPKKKLERPVKIIRVIPQPRKRIRKRKKLRPGTRIHDIIIKPGESIQ